MPLTWHCKRHPCKVNANSGPAYDHTATSQKVSHSAAPPAAKQASASPAISSANAPRPMAAPMAILLSVLVATAARIASAALRSDSGRRHQPRHRHRDRRRRRRGRRSAAPDERARGAEALAERTPGQHDHDAEKHRKADHRPELERIAELRHRVRPLVPSSRHIGRDQREADRGSRRGQQRRRDPCAAGSR